MSRKYPLTIDKRAFWGALAVVAAVSGGLYLYTLAPTVTGEDSGELISAAYTLGIPHPPGYPLWTLTAHAAIKLIPFGEVAWRANLVSALFGVLTACTIAAIVMRLTASGIAAVTGGLSFAFAHEVWEQSTIAEVYTQFAFLFALTLYFVLRWRETGLPRHLYGAAFAAGLGVVAHGLMLLPLPVFVVAALWPREGAWTKWTQAVTGAAAFAAPFALLLYLPIRSSADPAMDWGNPESFAAFWDVTTRAQYEDLLVGNPRSVDRLWGQLGFFVRELIVQGVAIAGIVALLLSSVLRRFIGVFLAALFLATSVGSILLTNFPMELPDVWLNGTYWIPAYCVLCVGLGDLVGLLWMMAQRPWIPRLFRVVPILVALACIGASAAILFGPREVLEYRNNRFVHEYAENALKTLPENAIYIGGGDHTIFPLLYLQIVEEQRTDVTIANPYGYIDLPRVDGLAEAFPEEAAKTIPSEESEPLMIEWIAKNSGRPVYTADPYKLDGLRCTRHGVLYRVASPGDTLENFAAIWKTYSFTEKTNIHDWSSRLIQFDYFIAAAERDYRLGKPLEGEKYLHAATVFAAWTDHYGGGDKHAFNNLGVVAARGGSVNLAEEFWLKALELDPDFETAQRNLAKLREN